MNVYAGAQLVLTFTVICNAKRMFAAFTFIAVEATVHQILHANCAQILLDSLATNYEKMQLLTIMNYSNDNTLTN